MLLTYIFIIVPPTIFFYTLSLHDALPISPNGRGSAGCPAGCGASRLRTGRRSAARWWSRCSWCLLLDAVLTDDVDDGTVVGGRRLRPRGRHGHRRGRRRRTSPEPSSRSPASTPRAGEPT